VRTRSLAPHHAVILWLLGSASVTSALRCALDTQVTLGDLIATLVPVAIAAFWWAVHTYRRANPFTVCFPVIQEEVTPGLEYVAAAMSSSQATLRVGRQELYIRVTNRFGTQLEWFSPGFGTLVRSTTRRKWFARWLRTWDIAPSDVIEIEDVRVLPNHGKDYQCDIRKRPHKIDVYLEPKRRWAADEPLEIVLTVNAKQSWSGVFSFQSLNRQHDKRCATRNKVDVM